MVQRLCCSECGKKHAPAQLRWKCDCGGILDLEYENTFEKDMTRGRGFSMWRYREAIPVSDEKNIVSLEEGFTPLLEYEIDGRKILFKQEQLFSTGSYKDRGASVLVSKACELGVKNAVEDSSGNAGASIAAYCARAGIRCDIYVPRDTSSGKLSQIRLYGARLHLVPGSREDTAGAVMEAADRCYYASHTWNPWFLHGTKTFAYETAEQLSWKAPDAVVLPAGNGTLFLGAYIGFRELAEKGITDHIPVMVGVQAEACAPLGKAFREGGRVPAEVKTGETAAEGIAIAKPARGKQILSAVRDTGGMIIETGENQIKRAFFEAAAKGFFIEPTSAAVLAGVREYIKTLSRNKDFSKNCIVSVFTGHGLKAGERISRWMD